MIRLIIASVFLVIAIFVFLSEVVGFFRFRYVLDRVHAAGLGDTLGIISVAIAAAVLWGEVNAVIKLILIVGFMMLTGPVLTHLLTNIEVRSHKNAGNEYEEEDRA